MLDSDMQRWTLKEHLANGSDVDAFFENEVQTTLSDSFAFTEIIDANIPTALPEEEVLVLESSSSSSTFKASASMLLYSPLYLLYSIPWLPPVTFAPQWSLSSFYLPWLG